MWCIVREWWCDVCGAICEGVVHCEGVVQYVRVWCNM